MIFKEAVKNAQINHQRSFGNKANIFEEELKIRKRKFIIKIYAKRVMCIAAISLLVAASVFYDLEGEESVAIILFLYSICLTVSAYI